MRAHFVLHESKPCFHPGARAGAFPANTRLFRQFRTACIHAYDTNSHANAGAQRAVDLKLNGLCDHGDSGQAPGIHDGQPFSVRAVLVYLEDWLNAYTARPVPQQPDALAMEQYTSAAFAMVPEVSARIHGASPSAVLFVLDAAARIYQSSSSLVGSSQAWAAAGSPSTHTPDETPTGPSAAMQAVPEQMENLIQDIVLPELLRRLQQPSSWTAAELVDLFGVLARFPAALKSDVHRAVCVYISYRSMDVVPTLTTQQIVQLLAYMRNEGALIPRDARILQAMLQQLVSQSRACDPLSLSELCSLFRALLFIKDTAPKRFCSAIKPVSMDVYMLKDCLSEQLVATLKGDLHEALTPEDLAVLLEGMHLFAMRDRHLLPMLCRAAVRLRESLLPRSAYHLLASICTSHNGPVHNPFQDKQAIPILIDRILSAGIPTELSGLKAAKTCTHLWTPFECWKICCAFSAAGTAWCAADDYLTVLEHTDWNPEETGQLYWARVFVSPEVFVQRMAQLDRRRVPPKVLSRFLAAAAAVEGFLEPARAQDLLLLLRQVVKSTPKPPAPFVEDILRACVAEAHAGQHMEYATYAAARLGLREPVTELIGTLGPYAASANLLDVANVVWAAARARVGRKVSLDPFLERLKVLLLRSELKARMGPCDAVARSEAPLGGGARESGDAAVSEARAAGRPDATQGRGAHSRLSHRPDHHSQVGTVSGALGAQAASEGAANGADADGGVGTGGQEPAAAAVTGMASGDGAKDNEGGLRGIHGHAVAGAGDLQRATAAPVDTATGASSPKRQETGPEQQGPDHRMQHVVTDVVEGRVPAPGGATGGQVGRSDADRGKEAGIDHKRMKEVKPWVLAQVVWGLAEMELYEYKHIVSYMLDILSVQRLAPIDIANILWGATVMDLKLDEMPGLYSIKQHLQPPLQGWRPKEVATVLWACGRLQLHPGMATLDAMGEVLLMRSKALSTRHLSNGITGLGLLNHMPDRQLLEILEQRLIVQMGQAAPKNLSVSLFSFVRLAFEPVRLLRTLQAGLPQSCVPIQNDLEACVKVLWCLATFDACQFQLYMHVMELLADLEERPEVRLTKAMMYEVVLAHWTMERHGVKPDRVPHFVKMDRESILQNACLLEDTWNKGFLQCLQSHFVRHHKVNAQVGARTTDGLLRIDVLLPSVLVGSRPVALEVLDGRHTTENTNQACGRWLVRKRLLETYGYHVVAVSERAWNSVPDKDAHVKRLLAGARWGGPGYGFQMARPAVGGSDRFMRG